MDLQDLEQAWGEPGALARCRCARPEPGDEPASAIQAVAFDWDGTLAHSEGAATAALHEAIEWAARRAIAVPAAFLSTGSALDPNRLARDSHRLDQADPVVRKFRKVLLDGERRSVALRPSATSLLGMLRSNGILLAVVSGRDRMRLRQAIDVAGLSDAFHCVVSSEDALPKPHPSSLWRVADSFGIRLADLRMVGNGQDDFEAANAAGVRYFHIG